MAAFSQQKAAHLRLGQRGEDLACRLLRETGFDILMRNYRTSRGEIDMVARQDQTLVFVEVKTRHYRPGCRPADAVGRHKRRRLLRAAAQYLRDLGQPAILYRFDIIGIVLRGGRLHDVRHYRAVFADAPRGLTGSRRGYKLY